MRQILMLSVILLALPGCVVMQPVPMPIPTTPVCDDPAAGAA